MAKTAKKADSYDHILKYVTSELSVARHNQDPVFNKFRDYYKMLHCAMDSKMDNVESDIQLPEFTARVLTLIGDFVARYFASRDFVDVHLESDDPVDVMEGKASKTLINKLLSLKDVYYYHKIVRTLMFVFVCGYGVIKGGYKQQVEEIETGTEDVEEYLQDPDGNYIAEDGMPFTDPNSQVAMKQISQKPIIEKKVIVDRPDFDVFPVDDVYCSPEYAYSFREKRWVIFRTYQTIDQLEADKDMCGYFNLDKLRTLKTDDTTKPKSKHIADSDEGDEPVQNNPMVEYQVYERWGKHWVMDDGKPGIAEDGQKKDGAKLKECIISWVATQDGDLPELLIRFQPSPFSKRPVTRFNCYIDAYEDRGFGDGEPVYQLTVAINDTFNVSNLRTLLATMPHYKGRKFQSIPNKIKPAPGGVTFLENMDDLQEFETSDNIQGAMVQIGALSNGIDTVMSVSPVRMGVSGDRKETATVGAMMNQNANIRSGLRTTTLEFAGFAEFYDMLLSLVNDFMLPETLVELIGEELAMAYNPKREDRFIPVSQALETEDSKQFKMSMIDQLMGRVVSIPNPKTPMVINYLMGMWLDLAGGNFKHFKKFMFEEDPQMNALYQAVTGGKMMGSTPNANMMPTQNQTGLPQPGQEQQVRAAAGPAAMQQ
jgi:hypothetical protein